MRKNQTAEENRFHMLPSLVTSRKSCDLLHFLLGSSPSENQALDKVCGFLLLPFFLLSSSLLRKPKPPCFLLGTIARCFEPKFTWRVFTRALGVDKALWLSEWRRDGFCASASLDSCLPFGDFRTPSLGSSSSSIRSRREERLGKLLLVPLAAVLVVENTLSNSAASLGVASAFSCFPKFRMVSWHSASFTEAVVISHP